MSTFGTRKFFLENLERNRDIQIDSNPHKRTFLDFYTELLPESFQCIYFGAGGATFVEDTDINGLSVGVAFGQKITRISLAHWGITERYVYYSETLPVIHRNYPKLDTERHKHSLDVEIQNCRDIVGAIKTHPRCKCCGLPLKYVEQYTYHHFQEEQKHILASKNAEEFTYVVPKNALSIKGRNYISNLSKTFCDSIWVHKCPNCHIIFYPWDSLDVYPEYGTLHEKYICHCGQNLRYDKDDAGKQIYSCPSCYRKMNEEEALIVYLAGGWDKSDKKPW